MKKLFLEVAIIMMGLTATTFTSCSKEEITEKKGNSVSYTMRCSNCGAGASKLKIFYPPSSHSHLPPSFNCTVCGHSGNFVLKYN